MNNQPEKNQPDILHSDDYIEKFIKNGLPDASGGEKFQHLFGRDSLQISDDFLTENPKLAHDVIIKLAEFQGVKSCSKSEEDPGKIMHEQATNKLLQLIWTDKNDQQKLVYFSGDSTPMFINLINRYTKVVPDGSEILSETIQKKDGQTESIVDCVRNSANWIVDNMGSDGLVSVKRRSKLENFFGHGWKDSATAYIHEDGSLVRMTGRIVYPEIQTLSYDALTNAAELIEQDEKYTYLAETYYLQANKIQRGVFNSMWNPDEQYFVSCLEQDRAKKSDKMLPVNTAESTAGRMLNSRIFDNLPEEDKKKYIEPVIKKLFSDKFLTDAGIRTRSRDYKYSLNFTDYHGSEVSWPMDTYKIAYGLRKQGFSKLAEELENRIMNTVNLAGKYLEFFFVRDDGSAIVNYETKKKANAAEIMVAQFAPEENQGWTVSACHAIEATRCQEQINESQNDQPEWKKSLQNSILSSVKNTPIYETTEELIEAYPERPTTIIDTAKAMGRTAIKVFFSAAKELIFSRPNEKIYVYKLGQDLILPPAKEEKVA
jgi:glycogen debranching enzyme